MFLSLCTTHSSCAFVPTHHKAQFYSLVDAFFVISKVYSLPCTCVTATPIILSRALHRTVLYTCLVISSFPSANTFICKVLSMVIRFTQHTALDLISDHIQTKVTSDTNLIRGSQTSLHHGSLEKLITKSTDLYHVCRELHGIFKFNCQCKGVFSRYL